MRRQRAVDWTPRQRRPRHFSFSGLQRLREVGKAPERPVGCAFAANLGLDTAREIVSPHRGNHISSLDVDAAEDRFLLSAALDGRIAAFDLARLAPQEPLRNVRTVRPTPHNPNEEGGAGADPGAGSIHGGAINASLELARDSRGHAGGVTAVQWYPVDTGLFVSAGLDGRVKAWDANAFLPLTSWQLDRGAKAWTARFSRSAASAAACLVACGSSDGAVKVFDLRVGASVATLPAHAADVFAIDWQPPADEASMPLLCTGGRDGAIRLWDLRKSGRAACVAALDRFGGAADGNGVLGFEGPSVPRPSLRRSRRPDRRPEMCRAHEGAVTGVAFAPNGLLVSCGTDCRVFAWRLSADDGIGVWHFPGADNGALWPVPLRVKTDGPLWSSLIVYPTRDADLLLYPIFGRARWRPFEPPRGGAAAPGSTHAPIARLKGHCRRVRAVALRAAESQMVTGGDDSLLLLWSLRRAARPAKKAAAPAAGEGAGDGAVRAAFERVYGGAERGRAPDEDAWSDDDGVVLSREEIQRALQRRKRRRRVAEAIAEANAGEEQRRSLRATGLRSFAGGVRDASGAFVPAAVLAEMGFQVEERGPRGAAGAGGARPDGV